MGGAQPVRPRGPAARHAPVRVERDREPGPARPVQARPADRIEPIVLRESAAFVARLRRLGIPARVDLYGPGTHTWPYWQRELHRSWPLLMGAIGA